MYAEILELAKAGEGIAGSFFWSAVSPTFPQADALSIKLAEIPRGETQGLAAHITHLIEGSGMHTMQSTEPPRSEEEDTTDKGSQGEIAREEADNSQSGNDEAMINIIMDHASHVSSLNAGWLPGCPVM